eukprot:gene26624-32698_t
MMFEDTLVYISLFATAKTYRYRKLGSLLMAWLKHACLDLDLKFVVVGALKTALPIWKHLGFQGPQIPASLGELRTYVDKTRIIRLANTHALYHTLSAQVANELEDRLKRARAAHVPVILALPSAPSPQPDELVLARYDPEPPSAQPAKLALASHDLQLSHRHASHAEVVSSLQGEHLLSAAPSLVVRAFETQ